MSDIFLSYARADAPRAIQLAMALETAGWSVWYDRDIPAGATFDQVIEEALDAAKCVIVLWSHQSVESRSVRSEADYAQERRVVIPVTFNSPRLPLRYRAIQTLDLTAWNGSSSAPEFWQLATAVEHFAGKPNRSRVASIETGGEFFVSYSREDKTYVTALLSFLRARSLSVWADDQIDYGDRWWKTIVANLRACRALIVVMTPHSEESKWVERELMFADELGKPIFPLLLAGKRFPLLVGIQHHDVSDGSMPPAAFVERLGGIATGAK